MNSIVALKTQMDDDFEVQFEVLPPVDLESIQDSRRREIALALQSVEEQLQLCNDRVAELNSEIDRLTCHADGLDYTIAVASGILTGLIDSFFVGDYNPNIEEIVTEFAKKKAGKKSDTINDYKDARKWLEKNYHTDNDGAYKTGKDIFGRDVSSNGHTHRLDDLAHHPTLLGLCASIFFQFFRVAIFVNKNGKIQPVWGKEDIKELVKMWIPAIVSGVMLWLANIAEKYCEDELDSEIPKPIRNLIKLISSMPILIQILKCADTWFAHIMSDVGPRSDGSQGKGIPGFFLSLLKEISMLPIIKNTELPEILQSWYNSGKFNFDKELVIIEKMKKQAIPVIFNEVVVRAFYFVRHLITEYQKYESFEKIDWEKVIPVGNRTIERMLTIATGTFTAVDMADAAIHAASKSVDTATFVANMVLRVNFVGVGRFAIAVGTDVGMGLKRGSLVDERIKVMGQELTLLNAKVYYKCAQLHYSEVDMLEAEEDMWLAAQDTEQTLAEVYAIAEESVVFVRDSLAEINQNMERISSYRAAIEEHNPGLTKDISNILKWGKK